MLVKLLNGATAWLIGDPHLGKTFEAGVPLDRRGEREARQLAKFKKLLDYDADYIVVMGDLFDHPYVSFSVVLDAYKALANAAASHTKCTYIVIAGNHDVPRNLEAVGAFHVLESMCHLRAENLHVLSKTAQVGPIACFPWKWHIPAAQQQIIAPVDNDRVDLVVGHWDLQVFGENTDHLAPTEMLTKCFPDAPLYSGHYHVPGPYSVNGVTVTCTGSMEPYSHGEDPNGDIYITTTPAELERMDPASLREKCIRVLLKEGEEMPSGIDCFALTPKRFRDESIEQDEIVLGNFSWDEIVQAKLADLPVKVKDFITERLKA